ncbi:hypothetical protein Q2Q20_003713 [Escherichia coli]|uniref:hypothetical protein n=1 Tax=Escherichia coli TaxID=562 RepID=UPI001CE26187|nr:hypothetical protein [Escherichia coli]MEB0896805.1 hypothetical protein [Citrobacter freundii]EIY1690321.1 hypothetical protein [Escherichia coli]ELM7939280.1 hypothetical protein [Escherichia coli]ELM7962924.1 hypothetical protein [Escherichia coli]ELM7972515.1 hypothetical protein [Escherichia coli]
MAFNPLNRQTMEESWLLTVAFNPLNRQTMEESWSCPVVFNSLNRQTMGGSWSGTVAFNPLIGRPWRDYCRVPGHLTTYSSVHDGMLVA